jgi:hypothetical protein
MSTPATAPGPWSWRIPVRHWFVLHEAAFQNWRPAPELNLAPTLPGLLAEAASREERWLYHPFATAATIEQRNVSRDLRLALWAAIHDERIESEVNVPAQTWMWTADGGGPIEPGRHDLRALAQQFSGAKNSGAGRVEMDLWIDTVGLPLPDGIVDYERWSWAHCQPLSPEDEGRLQREVVAFLVAREALMQDLSACASWVADVTRVIVPLRGTPETRFRSGSSASIPGLVFTDIDGPVEQIIESLVHESAHHWLCVAEAAGPLVDPAHTLRYTSPLRTDPRPLRGIFLAFHALAFMSAYYREWSEIHPERKGVGKMLDGVRRLRDDALQTMRTAESALTDIGREVYRTTVERVVAYAG